MSFFPLTILEDLHIHPRWVVLAQMRSDLDRAMDHVIVPDKSADKADDDDGRRGNRDRAGRADRARRDGSGEGGDEAENTRNATD